MAEIIQLNRDFGEQQVCSICRHPMTSKTYNLRDSSGNTRRICTFCAEVAMQPTEEIKGKWLEVKAIREKEVIVKQCIKCKDVKSEAIRTFAFPVKGTQYQTEHGIKQQYETSHICETCLGRMDLTAKERMTLNSLEMLAKKHTKE